MRRLLFVVLLSILLMPLGGCGGSDDGGTAKGALEAQEAARELAGDASDGARVWVTAGCEACHTLVDAKAKGTSGPNLDKNRPSAELVVDRVALGFRAMPTYQGLLTPQQIADVGAYVAELTRE